MEGYDRDAAELADLARAWCGTPLDFSGPVSDEEIATAERELGVVFPKSYRVFLRHYGAGNLHYHEIFGLSHDGLWRDIVMMNQRAAGPVPRHYLKFTEDVGDFAYYLDTSQMNGDGECPVVVMGPEAEGEVVAESFIDFVRKASAGLI